MLIESPLSDPSIDMIKGKYVESTVWNGKSFYLKADEDVKEDVGLIMFFTANTILDGDGNASVPAYSWVIADAQNTQAVWAKSVVGAANASQWPPACGWGPAGDTTVWLLSVTQVAPKAQPPPQRPPQHLLKAKKVDAGQEGFAARTTVKNLKDGTRVTYARLDKNLKDKAKTKVKHEKAIDCPYPHSH